MSYLTQPLALAVAAENGYRLPADTPYSVLLAQNHLIAVRDELDRLAAALDASVTALTAAWQGQTATVLVTELGLAAGEVRRAVTATDDAAGAARDYRRTLDDLDDDLDRIRRTRENLDLFRDESRQLALTGPTAHDPAALETRLADADDEHARATGGLFTEYFGVCQDADAAARTFGRRLAEPLPYRAGFWAGLFSDPAGDYAAHLAGMLASVELVLDAGAGYEPGAPGGPRFVVGPPTRPSFVFDDDFPYDPDAEAGWRDYADWARWQAILEGGELARADLDDATALYQHYLDGDGEPRTVDYEEGYREDAHIRLAVDGEIAVARQWAEQLAADSGQAEFSMTGDPVQAQDYTGGQYPTAAENWDKTLGGYQMWSNADVRVDGQRVTMTITVHAEDRYNFNRDAADIATGLPDNANGRFAELGWAHPFDVSGELTRTVTWTVGDPAPPQVVEAGDRNATPAAKTAKTNARAQVTTDPCDQTTTPTPAGPVSNSTRRPPGTPRRRPLAVAAAATALVAVSAVTAGCTSSPPADDPRTESPMSPATRNPPEAGVRTDLEPLVSRFPDLGTPTSAAWQSGTVGTSRLPPTIYWIDAVVTLEPATAAALRATPGLAPTDPPQVATDLQSFLPPGSWTTSPDLSTSFSKGGWACQVYLATDTDVAVLVVKGRPENQPTLG